MTEKKHGHGHGFQGGSSFEVFTAQNKDAYQFWKYTNLNQSTIKVFDKDVKSFVFGVESMGVTARIQNKDPLCLTQRFLVFQLIIPANKDFFLELGILDLKNGRRRFTLSTNNKSINITPTVTKLPLGLVRQDTWMNLCLDMRSLVTESWKGQDFRHVHSIDMAGHCRLRRIFTMKSQPEDTTDDDVLYECPGTNERVETDSLPRHFCVGSTSSIQQTQVIHFDKVRHYVSYLKPESPRREETETDLNASGDRRRNSDKQRVAFGSHVAQKSSRSDTNQSKTSRAELDKSHTTNSSRTADGNHRQQPKSSRSEKPSGHQGSKTDRPSHRKERPNFERQSSRDRSTSKDEGYSRSKHEGSSQKGSSTRKESAQKEISNREGSSQKRYSSRDRSGRKESSSREGLAKKELISREGSAQKHVSSREGSAQQVSSREGSAQKQVSSREGSAQKQVSSREGSAQKHASSREGSAQKQASSREGSSQKMRRDGSLHRSAASRDGSGYQGSREGSASIGASSRENSGGQTRTAVKDNSQISSKRQNKHSRPRSETDNTLATPHQQLKEQSALAPNKQSSVAPNNQSTRALTHTQVHDLILEVRDRCDSDPGTAKVDPEVKVDKDSLKSSHTWTDGADGKAEIPYVQSHKPHPPSEPSSAKQRRTRPVRSAGKERTPHAGQYKVNAEEAPPVAYKMANEDEEAEILRKMQESVRQSRARYHESTTSDDNSLSRGNDDLTDVINALNSLSNNQSSTRSDTSDTNTGGHEYEDSDDEDSSQPQSKTVYRFSSRPKQLEHQDKARSKPDRSRAHRSRDRRKSSDKDTELTLDSIGHYQRPGMRRNNSNNKISEQNRQSRHSDNHSNNSIIIKNNQSSENNSKPESSKYRPPADQRTPRGEVTSQLRQRVRNKQELLSAPSSEEEPQRAISARIRKQRSPRQKPRASKPRPYLIQNGCGGGEDRRHFPENGLGSRANGSDVHTHHHREFPENGLGSRMHGPDVYTPSGVYLQGLDPDDMMHQEEPLSVSRKSLREIPGPSDSLRHSGGVKPYNPQAYQNGLVPPPVGPPFHDALIDSTELGFLQEIQRTEETQTSESSSKLSDEESESSDHTQQNTQEFRSSSKFRFRGSDSEEDMGTMSTLEEKKVQREPGGYPAEMRMMDSLDCDTLNQSQSRLSLSPQIPRFLDISVSTSSENGHFIKPPKQNLVPHNGVKSRSSSSTTGCDTETGGEDETLDLLYDHVLNKYYDPTTNKYYELV